MSGVEPQATARRVVTDEAPDARCAYLGASVLGPARTPTSDLDIAIVRADHAPPLRRVFRRYGWLVEVFLLDEAVLRQYWDRDVRSRIPALLRVIAEGTSVGPGTPLVEALQNDARALLAAGPRPLTPAEVDRRRFLVSDLLDDLTSATPALERPYISNALLTHVTELTLLAHGRWLGEGKWLARELAAYDSAWAQRLASAHAAAVAGRIDPFRKLTGAVLDSVGGRLPPES